MMGRRQAIPDLATVRRAPLLVKKMFYKQAVSVTAAAILVLVSGFPVAAKSPEKDPEPTGGRISGKVFAADGKTAVGAAVVKAVPLQGGETRASSPSNAKGEFSLDGLTFGYYDLIVEAASGTYIANQVVNVPPSGKLVIQFALTPYGEKSPSWWAGREPRALPGGGTATGSAELRQRQRGAEFWKSPGGIAVIAGIGGVALLAIASGGGYSSTTASASTP